VVNKIVAEKSTAANKPIILHGTCVPEMRLEYAINLYRVVFLNKIVELKNSDLMHELLFHY
jgi:hypothetical protein